MRLKAGCGKPVVTMKNKYAENLRNAITARESEKKAMGASVLEVTHKACAEAVKKFPSLMRISLVGSIAGGGFSKNSDVDIVIAGLAKNDYFRLAVFLEKKIGRYIDLIMEEDLSEADKRHIFKNREVIHGSKKG